MIEKQFELSMEQTIDSNISPLLAEAIQITRDLGYGSPSALQKHLRIGYNLADKLMQQMEDKGIVGKRNGTKPRELLVKEPKDKLPSTSPLVVLIKLPTGNTHQVALTKEMNEALLRELSMYFDGGAIHIFDTPITGVELLNPETHD